ncbi:MAG: PAS domain-containing sensor histidine kinase, partial [Rhodoferax sp.]
MTSKATSRSQALRNRAEDVVHNQQDTKESVNLQDLSHEDMRKLVHELQVHQIELEMQNEELRQTQAELDNARSRYFDLYDLAPVGYCTVSENSVIQEANFTAAAMLDLVRSDLVNKHVSQLVVKSDQDTYYQCRKALLETGAPQDCELQMLKRDGTVFWVHMRVTAAHDSSGAPVQRMVLSDITERKHLDSMLLVKSQELEISRKVADKASQAKTDFLSNMTHELRSPLNAILGFAQLLEMATPAPSPAQTTNINQILRAGWYLLDLVGEILDLTSIEAGRLRLTVEPTPLSGVLQECQKSISTSALKKNLHLHFDPVSTTLMVDADRDRLVKVVLHLLSNAIKYNRSGGDVEVSCSVPSGNKVRLS